MCISGRLNLFPHHEIHRSRVAHVWVLGTQPAGHEYAVQVALPPLVTAPSRTRDGFLGSTQAMQPHSQQKRVLFPNSSTRCLRTPRLVPRQRRGSVHRSLRRPLEAGASFKTEQVVGLNALSVVPTGCNPFLPLSYQSVCQVRLPLKGGKARPPSLKHDGPRA